MSTMDPKIRLLKALSLFAPLSSQDLERVAQLTDEVDVPAGRVLMRQGENGEEMFIVVSGGLAIERDGRSLGSRGPGEPVGEMSLISKGPRSATVTAEVPTRLLVLAHREFHALVDRFPAIRLSLLEVLAARLRSLDSDEAH